MYRRGRNGELQNGKMAAIMDRDGAEPKVATMLAEGFPEGGKLHTKANADGTMRVQAYLPPVKANPGTLIKVIVGGGVMGSKLAHENEAPFPEKLAEFFIKSWCPVGGIVLDPFSGSGTTVCVARRLGRCGVGLDLRASQIELATRRLAEPAREETSRRMPQIANCSSQGVLFSPEVSR